MNIQLLADHVEVIPTLTDWYLSEWEPYYGVHGPGDARADLESRCNREQLPVGLVALAGDQVWGTAALDLDATTNLSPSVVGVLVERDHRRRGIATAMLEAAADVARRLGYNRLYISTTVLGGLLERIGWYAMGEVEFLNAEQGSIYTRSL